MKLTNKLLGMIATPLIALSSYAQSPSDIIWKDVSLITPEEAQITYGDKIPEGVYTSIDDVWTNEIQNGEQIEGVRVNIGEGYFTSNNYLNIWNKPALSIIGLSPLKTTLDVQIHGRHLEFEKIATHGKDLEHISHGWYFFTYIAQKGRISNCILSEYAGVVLSPNTDILLENNIFEGTHNPFLGSYAIGFISNSGYPALGGEIIKMNGNEFKNISQVFNIFQQFDKQIFGVSEKNAYLNVDTVVVNNNNFTEDFTDSFWADEITPVIPAKLYNNLYIYTDPVEILEKKVINSGNGSVDVNNPLHNNPIPNLDYDGDGVTNQHEYTFGTDPYNAEDYLELPLSNLRGNLVLGGSILASAIYLLSRKG